MLVLQCPPDRCAHLQGCSRPPASSPSYFDLMLLPREAATATRLRLKLVVDRHSPDFCNNTDA